jgi:hypothetical protein
MCCIICRGAAGPAGGVYRPGPSGPDVRARWIERIKHCKSALPALGLQAARSIDMRQGCCQNPCTHRARSSLRQSRQVRLIRFANVDGSPKVAGPQGPAR